VKNSRKSSEEGINVSSVTVGKIPGDNGYSKQAMKNPEASSKQVCLPVSSLDRKFVILAGAIPRSENRFTTLSVTVNFPEQALNLTRKFRFITGFRADSSPGALRLGTGKMVDTGIPGGLPPVIRVEGRDDGGK
jgi:hypothetical protein